MTGDKFKVGAKVYNGNSMSPHAGSGNLDKGGYKQRDAKAKIKQQMLKDQIKKRGQK